MTQPKFSPGPWEISRYTNYIGYSISAPGAGCIAERWYASEHETAPIAENAALIAAAPDMYEALSALVEAFKGDEQMECGYESELTAARAALAKAGRA